MLKAISLGFGVAKPWGDSDRYDFILNAGHAFCRVQVKSIWVKRYYTVKTSGHSCSPYTADEIDFLAVYIIPEDLWYVLPVALIGGRKAIYIRPSSPRCVFQQYRENWDLFRVLPT